MNGRDRRRRLLSWIEEEGGLAVAAIAERFGVSKMTVHRDLDNLEQRGLLRRVHGGAYPLSPRKGETAAEVTGPELASRLSCMVCLRPASQHLLYSMTLRDGQQRIACCAHCGVSAQLALGAEVVMAMSADYLSGRLHAVRDSVFLLGSSAVPCCQPSMLTFSELEMARRFQRGFGGELGGLAEAEEFLRQAAAVPGCSFCDEVSRAETGGV